MRAKDYLSQIARLDIMINNKLIEIDRWKEIALGTTAQSEGERVQTSGSKQKMADAVCRYVQIEAEVQAEIDQLIATKQAIIHDIEKLSPNEYDVLHRKYVQFKKLYEIAVDMRKSYSWVKSAHGSGLANLQKLLNNRKREVGNGGNRQ